MLNKEKIETCKRKKMQVTYEEILIRIPSEFFQWKLKFRKAWSNTFQVLKDQNYYTILLHYYTQICYLVYLKKVKLSMIKKWLKIILTKSPKCHIKK